MNCAFPAVRPASSAQCRGVALVITLIMLSVVTITAVAFLAMSRRERLSVGAYGEQLEARYLADTALNRAKGDLLGRMFLSSNRFAYGFAVSTNYRNTNFVLNRYFPNSGNYGHLTNVAYSKGRGAAAVFDFNLAGNATDRENYAGLLGNLYYDPRPPVFVQTNSNTRLPWEFRYYLDLNRNQRFETNGWVTATDMNGVTVTELQANGSLGPKVEFQVGDPEWVGLLEHPDLPHSGTNRFIGRFAYLILPTGRSLDLNFMGNNAKSPDTAGVWPVQAAALLNSGYLRNQGVGSWEVNLAGFARALNTNVWQLNDFRYFTTPVANTGLAFSDAERVLRFRRNGILQDDAERFFGYEVGILASSQGARLDSDRVDTYADGPVLNSINEVLQPSVQKNADDDKTGQPWSGSDELRRFTDINQLFDPALGLGARITGQDLLAVPLAQRRAGHTNSTYNAYTYYRAIGQLGTDSPDARFESGFHSAYGRVNGGRAALPTYYRRAKLNLNYAHDPDGDGMANASVAALERWTPLNWFINAADRLLLSEFTNGLPIVRSPEIRRLIANDPTGYTPYGFPVFGSVVARDGSLTNYVYDSQVHRLLQFAANIYDYANASAEYDLKVTAGPGTNNYRLQAPHVYRPRFYVDQRDLDRDALNPVLRIGGYELVENTTAVADRWLTPQEAVATVPRGLPGKIEPSTQINVLGMPWIIGAKKGLPNFNEGFWQSAMQVTRRMRLVKPVAATTLPANQSPFSSGAAGRGVRAQVQYRVTLTNSVGVEAWNSYNFDFPVAVQVQVRQTNHYAVYAEFQNGLRKVWPATAAPIVANNLLTTHTLPAGKWRASEFVGVATNYLADFIYDPGTLRAFPAAATNFGWVDVATPPPALTLAVTNRMVFSILSAGNPQRVLDVVSMQSVVYETNILRYLGAPAGIGGIQIASSRSSDSRPGGEMSQFWLTNSAGLAGTAGISNQLSASLGRYDNIGNLWRDARGAGVRLEDRQFAIDGLNYFLYQTNRAGLTAAQIETIRRQFGGTNVQAGFNPSPLVVFTDRRQANDPLVHQLKDDLLPGYTAVAIAAPGFPGAYAAEVERNGARLIQGGSVWPLNWRPVQPGQPLTRWFNAVTGPVGFRISSDWPANLTTNYWTAQIRPYRNSDPIALRKFQQAGSPWGKVPQLGATATGGADFSRQNLGIKDPQIASSDNWRFLAQTTNAPTDLEHLSYPNLGWLGRVHRGTPWQTAYLKSAVVDLRQQNGLEGAPWIALFFGEINDWASWAGNANTHPVNDWKLMDLFTTAVNDNAAHGLLAVNQTNLAAWAAVLSGVPVLDNRANSADPQSLILRPDSSEVAQILSGYTNQQAQVVTPGLLTMLTVTNSLAQGFPVTARAPGGTFTNLGSILSVPTLSDQAPFVIADPSAINVTDEVVERLPQQILSLLRADEPTVTVYAYGQSLKPAPNSFYLKPGNFYGMVTNYVVTGEFATKTLLRFEGTPNAPTTKVEDHRILFQNP